MSISNENKTEVEHIKKKKVGLNSQHHKTQHKNSHRRTQPIMANSSNKGILSLSCWIATHEMDISCLDKVRPYQAAPS